MPISTEITETLREVGTDFFVTYPCVKFQSLYNLIQTSFLSIGITKEEEGVGICAGASLSGAKPAMLIQSTGLGNMINALCSLTLTYQLPLLVLASWRGKFNETIPAQIKLGKSLPALLEAISGPPVVIESRKDLPKIEIAAQKAFGLQTLQVVLLSPLLWESDSKSQPPTNQKPVPPHSQPTLELSPRTHGLLTRYEILKASSLFLKNKFVVSNIGYPSRELYQVCHQPTNFYMLGSLGLASSIGLGIAIRTSKPVVVIDGDGSLLSNLGSLATIAQVAPKRFTILAIDNGVHGSTGNQPTATSFDVDLAETAKGLGFQQVYRGSTAAGLRKIFKDLGSGPHFIHIPAKPGNADVPVIPLTPLEIKQQFMNMIQVS
ncbi:MAG: sulfopyruvate decarboxylase subunit alpha [Promethearchaeota archaeon]